MTKGIISLLVVFAIGYIIWITAVKIHRTKKKKKD